MRRAAHFLLMILAFLGSCILGMVIGFAVGIGVGTLNNEGLFTPWRELKGPVKFSEIKDVSWETLWARGSDGVLYSWDFGCFRTPDCQRWIRAKPLPTSMEPPDGSPFTKSDSYVAPDYRFMRRPPGIPVDCAKVTTSSIETSTTDYFVLLGDGSIWLWERTAQYLADIWIAIPFTLLGLMIGIMTFGVLAARRSYRRADPKPQDR